VSDNTLAPLQCWQTTSQSRSHQFIGLGNCRGTALCRMTSRVIKARNLSAESASSLLEVGSCRTRLT
jgi:hypothetical protein